MMASAGPHQVPTLLLQQANKFVDLHRASICRAALLVNPQRIRSAVIARLGAQVDANLLDVIIKRVLNATGVK
jgi:hypothetical protein